MKILIDNGHGRNTPGKCSPDGLFKEYRYNREIASALVYKLHDMGYDTQLLVPEDEDIPLKTRAARVNGLCNEIGVENVILVSIHCNAAPPDDGQWHRARGWSAYTTKGETKSDILADFLYSAAERVFTSEKGLKVRRFGNSSGEKDWEEDFYILKRTQCTAVLTENFFMDNRSDLKYLLSKEGKKDIVDVHASGLENYLNSLR